MKALLSLDQDDYLVDETTRRSERNFLAAINRVRMAATRGGASQNDIEAVALAATVSSLLATSTHRFKPHARSRAASAVGLKSARVTAAANKNKTAAIESAYAREAATARSQKELGLALGVSPPTLRKFQKKAGIARKK
jgi:hypothetical protein